MSQWTAMAHLPTFWSTLRAWHFIVLVAVIVGVSLVVRSVRAATAQHTTEQLADAELPTYATANGRSRDEYIRQRAADAADHDAAPFEIAGFVLVMLGLVALVVTHASAHDRAVKDLAVDYVTSSTTMTVMSPVELTSEHSAAFEAVQPDGSVVDATVSWLAPSTRPYRADTSLPPSFNPFTISTKPHGPSR